MRVVIALGGNAMTSADGRAGPEDQRRAVEAAMDQVADLVAAGHQVVLTHGNGPQVGNLLVKNELAASVVPPVPLDWCVAQTQGTIGLLVLDALQRALTQRQRPAQVAALVSRTLVAADDPAFAEPSKPIGRYLPHIEARVLIEHGQTWQDRGDRGWRRVVASPAPLACLDADAALALSQAGYVVVCAGGGGVPVVGDAQSGYRGVEAVVDKDLTAALLAEAVGAEVLLIATDVPAAVIGWGTADARPLGRVTTRELAGYAAAGHFGSGSMAPKVAAACGFARRPGRTAAITALDRIGAAVAGTAGTIVTAEGD